MIFHVSIAADRPRDTAAVIAELWGGTSLPFPPHPGSYMVFAGDDRNSAIEVYPRGTELFPAEGDADVEFRINPTAARHIPVHFAIATSLTREAVEAIGAREGWIAKYRKRDDVFGVIELWVDNCLMIEVLTPEMQAEYATLSIEGWREFVEASGMLEAA